MTTPNHRLFQLDGSWSRAARWTLERAVRLNGYRSEIVAVDNATTSKGLVATALTVERVINGKRLIGGTVPDSGVVADQVIVQVVGQGEDASEVLRLESDVAFLFNDDDLDVMDIRPIVSRRRWQTLPSTTMAWILHEAMGHEGDTGHVEPWSGKMAQLVAKATVLRRTLTGSAQQGHQMLVRRWYATRKDDNTTESIGLPACAIGEAVMIAQLLRRTAAWTGHPTEWEDDRSHSQTCEAENGAPAAGEASNLRTRGILPARTPAESHISICERS